MNVSEDDKRFERELISVVPQMRAFARSLCGDSTAADDLVQDALSRAWGRRDSFELGTNMKAWTFMIVRNQYYSEKRRSWRWRELDQERAEATLMAADDADDVLALDEVRRALLSLTATQREAIILVGAGGLSYEEAAAIMGVALGTIKSRVSRARSEILRILEEGKLTRDDRPAGEAFNTIVKDVGRLSA